MLLQLIPLYLTCRGDISELDATQIRQQEY